MKLSKEEVEHIASLARLELSETEKEKFSEQLSEILGYVAILNEVDTKDVEPTAHSVGVVNVMEKDELKEQGIRKYDDEQYRDELLKNAPQVQEGFIKVPPVLD